MKDIILFPFSGNTREAVSVIEAINKVEKTWNIQGFIDDNAELWGKDFLGYKIIGGREKLLEYNSAKVLAAPGRPENYHKRADIINSLNLSPDCFASLIHPYTQIGLGTQIGYNTLIMAGVVTTVNVTIGNSCIIMSNTVISHDSKIDDFCSIGSNVSISGGVHIKPLCYIGTGAKIIQEVVIAGKTLVGIGTVVLKSTNPEDTIVGNPGKLLIKE